MEKITRAVRLLTAILLAFEAGLRVHSQIRKAAEDIVTEKLGDDMSLPDVGAVLRNAQETIMKRLRTMAENAGQHNDAPGSD